MRAIGFDDVDGPEQFAMALHDLSLEFAKQMKAENLANLDTGKLLAFRIFNVDSNFIREMRVHGVTPEYIAGLQSKGVKDLTVDKLVSLKIHGIE